MSIVKFDTIRTVAYSSVTSSYTAVGASLTNNWRMFKITNNTDGDMMFSLNGTADNIFVPAGGFTLYDVSANAQPASFSNIFIMQLGSQFYIKYISAPSQGNVYIEGAYAPGV